MSLSRHSTNFVILTRDIDKKLNDTLIQSNSHPNGQATNSTADQNGNQAQRQPEKKSAGQHIIDILKIIFGKNIFKSSHYYSNLHGIFLGVALGVPIGMSCGYLGATVCTLVILPLYLCGYRFDPEKGLYHKNKQPDQPVTTQPTNGQNV